MSITINKNGHCLRCHQNYENLNEHHCGIKTATTCDDSCKLMLLSIGMDKDKIKESVKKILDFIQACRNKGYEEQTILEMLDNPYFLEDILENYQSNEK